VAGPRKPTVRRVAGGWEYTRPRTGFGGPEVRRFTTWREAIDAVDTGFEGKPGSCERAYQRRDGLSSVPAWSPLRG
jgi:hypothetical protein